MFENSRRSGWSAFGCVVALAHLQLMAACTDSRDVGSPNQTGPDASEADGGEPDSGADGEDAAADSAVDAGPDADGGEDAGPIRCDTAADCDDGRFCNGEERCVEGRCVEAPSGPCLRADQCVEAVDRCDCDYDDDGVISARCGGSDCDEDHDNHELPECGGKDCDDSDRNRYPGNAEVCDAAGHDEDCDLEEVAGPSKEENEYAYDKQRDRDGDGAMNRDCCNIDPKTLIVHYDPTAVYDCDDKTNSIGPDAFEVCDDFDNDCDDRIDEAPGSGEPLSLKQTFCFDGDGDGWGRQDRTALFCTLPPHYAPCRFELPRGEDCDDTDAEVHPGDKVIEVCDAKDNDCDGKLDQADLDVVPLPDQLSSLGTGTELACESGGWRITECPEGRRWCDESTILHGCETNIRRLATCQSCEPTTCRFACGERGCDEIQRVSVGHEHACAITSEGRIACWGRGYEGRLGNDGIVSSPIPVEVAGLRDAVEVSAGPSHSCAIVGEDRAVYCWGTNRANQLGSPDGSEYNPTPVEVAAFWPDENRLEDIAHVATGRYHTCAVARAGDVFCWGDSSRGRLGDNSDTIELGYPRPVQRRATGTVSGFDYVYDAVEVHAGVSHTCLVTWEGGVECWGDNTYGQIGDPALRQEPSVGVASPVPGISNPTQLATGDFHTCALLDGTVYCWGYNNHGQLGRPSSARDGEPLPVPDLSNVTAIAAGTLFTCALTGSGEVWCWGFLAWLGAGEQERGPRVFELEDSQLLAAGGFACASGSERPLQCWGRNFYGQLGIGRTAQDPQLMPEPVRPLFGSE